MHRDGQRKIEYGMKGVKKRVKGMLQGYFQREGITAYTIDEIEGSFTSPWKSGIVKCRTLAKGKVGLSSGLQPFATPDIVLWAQGDPSQKWVQGEAQPLTAWHFAKDLYPALNIMIIGLNKQ